MCFQPNSLGHIEVVYVAHKIMLRVKVVWAMTFYLRSHRRGMSVKVRN